MASRQSPTQSEFSEDLWSTKPSVDAMILPADLKSKRPSLRKRASRGLARFLIIFCIGVAATLAWQSHGDAAREMIANSSPQLGWLAPQAASLAQIAPDMITPAAPAAPSPELQQLKAMSFVFATVRQSVDQLAASQQQMASDIAKLQRGISVPQPWPAAAPASKPVPPTQTPQVR
jgi:hypothetical protein